MQTIKIQPMLKPISVFVLIAAAFLSIMLFASYSEGTQQKDSTATTNTTHDILPQVITSIDLNKDFAFAGEAVPMDNFDVRERLDRELLVNSYWHSSTVQNIKLANRYFPTISKILAQHGIPDDFKYLAVAESGLRNVGSPAGAKGLWQFMKATAREYDLEVNGEVDERYHLEKATVAACEYLRKRKERFGSWTMAAAAYNMGAAGLAKESNLQREDNYYDLNLNQETGRYVFRILAYKEILADPARFGFQIKSEHLYPPIDDYIHISVEETIPNLGEWAEEHGLSYRMLKVYNPWLISSSLPNSSGKEYLIRIPKK